MNNINPIKMVEKVKKIVLVSIKYIELVTVYGFL